MKSQVAGAVLFCALMICVAQASPDRVKFLEGPAAAAKLTQGDLDEKTSGYLSAGAPDIIAALNPPPAPDSAADKADVALFREIKASAREERRQIATQDDISVYDRFAGALGIMPDRANLPSLVRLLNRVADDTLAITSEAKNRFARARPYQRFALKHVCGVSPAKGSSYPSGHAAVSWAAALVMMEVAPANAQNLISRAVSYGNSRIICGLHFPADVEAGHFIGAAVIDRLFADPAFRRDLLCAKREFNAVAAGEKAEDLAACPFK